jgi:hypothetical protein
MDYAQLRTLLAPLITRLKDASTPPPPLSPLRKNTERLGIDINMRKFLLKAVKPVWLRG